MNSYQVPNSQRRVSEATDSESLLPDSPVPRDPPGTLRGSIMKQESYTHYEDPDSFTKSQKRNKFLYVFVLSFISFLLLLIYMRSTVLHFMVDRRNEAARDCTEGYTLFDVTGFCYKATVRQVSAELAKESCEEAGAHLVSIHSEAENLFVMNLYKGTLQDYRHYKDINMDRSSPWIGLAYDSDSEKWRWSDDSPVDYTNWAADEPNNLNERPVLSFIEIDKLNAFENSGKWHDIGDIPHDKLYPTKRAYICKKQNSSSPAVPVNSASLFPFRHTKKPVTTTQKPSKCSDGYDFFEETGFCYKVHTRRMPASEAHKTCQKEGAQLASIHSERENQYLADISRESNETIPVSNYVHTLNKFNEVWIGLVFRNSKWLWSDGTVIDFTNWGVSEPNNLDFETAATIMASKVAEYNPNGSRWNNVPEGGAQRALICKKRIS